MSYTFLVLLGAVSLAMGFGLYYLQAFVHEVKGGANLIGFALFVLACFLVQVGGAVWLTAYFTWKAVGQ